MYTAILKYMGFEKTVCIDKCLSYIYVAKPVESDLGIYQIFEITPSNIIEHGGFDILCPTLNKTKLVFKFYRLLREYNKAEYIFSHEE